MGKGIWVLLVLCGPPLFAQQSPLTIGDAVRQAVEEYPAVHASMEEASAAEAGVRLSRTSYLPRADFFGQVNRATRNNVFGLLLNEPFFSPISGPVFETNSNTSVWGSLAGVLVTWEPFDFGLRGAKVGVAEAGRHRAYAARELSRFEVETATSDAFLTVLAADQVTGAAKAAVERAKVLESTVGASVKAGLRPGADLERTKAERAAAEAQVIQAEKAARTARVNLAELMGAAPDGLAIEGGGLLGAFPGVAEEQGGDLGAHPKAREQMAAVEQAKAREKVVEKSFYPKFQIEGTSYARGTGARPDFTTRGGASGLGPNIQNWGVGMSVTFPAFEFAALREKKKVEAYREQAEAARYEATLRNLNGELEKARAGLEAARRIAALVPVQLRAAQAAEQQAAARYTAGLGTIAEVAEAQRLLAQTEIDTGLANLAGWRALLAVSAAHGDLEPFLKLSGR